MRLSVGLLVLQLSVANWVMAQTAISCANADSARIVKLPAVCSRQRDSAVVRGSESGASGIIRSPASALELKTSADTKEKTARATIGWVGRDAGGSTVGMTAGFEGPLNADSDEASTVGSLTGLAQGTRVTLGATWYRWNAYVHLDSIEIVCQQILDGRKRAGDPTFKDIDKVNGTWCFAGSDKLGDEDTRRLNGLVSHADVPVLFGLLLKGGRQEFKWIDAVNAADSSRSETSTSIGAAAAVFSRALHTLVLASAEVARGVKPGEPSQVCQPLEAAPTRSICKSGALAAPKRTTTQVLALEARRQVSAGASLALSVAYDVQSKDYEVSVPVYFLRNAQGLSGGVAGVWSSATHSLGLSVFVGGSASTAVSSARP